MTVQNRSYLFKEDNGAADFLAVVNQFLPTNDQAHLSQTCHLAQTIFKNNLGILLSSSLPSATLVTEFRQRRAAASPARDILHIKNLEGHQASATSLAMRSDGTRLYSGSFDHTIKIWDVTTGTCLQTLAEHTCSITALQMSHDEKMLFSGSFDTTIRVWDLETGNCLKTLQNTSPVRCLHISPDGKTLFCGSGFGPGRSDNAVQVLDIRTSVCLHTLCGHKNSVSALQISPDGKTLFSGSYDKTIKVWDVARRECLHTLSGHTCDVRSLQISPNRKMLVSGSNDTTIRVWDVAMGNCLQILDNESSVFSLQISPDGKTLFSGSSLGRIKVWDLVMGTHLHIVQDHAGIIFSLQISPDGKTLFSGNRPISVWNLRALPEERMTALSTEKNVANKACTFHKLPQSVRPSLSTRTSPIKRQRGKSPDDAPSHYEELAYYYLNHQISSALLEKQQLARDLYNAKFFLPGVAEAFTELSDKQEYLDTLQASLLAEESFQRLGRFSDFLKNKVYDMLYAIHSETKQLPTNTPSDYGRLAFHERGGCTATHRERAEAVLRVYPTLLRELNIEEGNHR